LSAVAGEDKSADVGDCVVVMVSIGVETPVVIVVVAAFDVAKDDSTVVLVVCPSTVIFLLEAQVVIPENESSNE